VHPSAVSPIQSLTGATANDALLGEGEAWRWRPEQAPEGPLSMVLSASDQRLVVYRGGAEIGRSRVVLDRSLEITGTHAFIVAQPLDDAGGARTTDTVTWIAIGVPGHEQEAGRPLTPTEVAAARLPPDFVTTITPYLVPGTVLVATTAPVLPHTTGVALQVLNADPPPTLR